VVDNLLANAEVTGDAGYISGSGRSHYKVTILTITRDHAKEINC